MSEANEWAIPPQWEVLRPDDPARAEVAFAGLGVLAVLWRDADGVIWEEPDLDVALPVAADLAGYREAVASGRRYRCAYAAGLLDWTAAELAEATGMPVGPPYRHADAVWPPELAAGYARLNWDRDEPVAVVGAATAERFWAALSAALVLRPGTTVRLGTGLSGLNIGGGSPPEGTVLFDGPDVHCFHRERGRLVIIAGRETGWLQPHP
ncbi:hypothetical protein [Catellatospora chokoriensis]|uniref:hypothetical protein n=1 Tax=Catellatospora chokoriensis TaxID=310353 RepID=UPI001781D958|nr:hypothetical protein [Catellatospora chokoriensis]